MRCLPKSVFFLEKVLSNAPASRCLLSLKRHCRQVSGWFYLTQFRDSNGEIILPYKERTGKKIFHVRRSSKQMDVESERVIKSFERLYGFTERDQDVRRNR